MKYFAYLLLLVGIYGLGTGLHAQPTTHLNMGDEAPAFAGTDQFGAAITSADLLQKGHVVVLFYRGSWCPVCKRHLSNLQDSLAQITDLGVSVVAITPEQPASMEKTIKSTGASFSVIHDADYTIMTDYGVNFEVTQENVPKYYNFTYNHAKKSNGAEEVELPVPATFILNPDGTIYWRHYDFDYHNRASVKDILFQLSDR